MRQAERIPRPITSRICFASVNTPACTSSVGQNNPFRGPQIDIYYLPLQLRLRPPICGTTQSMAKESQHMSMVLSRMYTGRG